MKIFFLFFILLTLMSCTKTKQDPHLLEIVFLANRQGEVEPCGCATGQKGGLDRLYNFYKKDKKQGLWISSGETFFEFFDLPKNEESKVHALSQAGLIAEVYRLLGVQYFVPGVRDLAAGEKVFRELIKKSEMKVVLSNLTSVKSSQKPLGEPFVVMNHGTHKIGFLGFVHPDVAHKIPGSAILDTHSALTKNILELQKQKVDLIIVISSLGLEKDKQLAQWGGAQMIFGSHSMDVISSPFIVNRSLVAQPDVEGKQAGSLSYDFQTRQVKRYALVDLGDDFSKSNQITKTMKDLKRNRKLAFSFINPSQKKTKTGIKRWVAHPRTCQKCHPKEYDVWKSTHHSSAYLVLAAKDQHYNPECVGCHSLGYLEEGGFHKVGHPWTVNHPELTINKKLPLEVFYNKVFEGDSKTTLDSRKEPERYKKLHETYHELLDKFSKSGGIVQNHMGIQCEHCHGSRVGHPHKKLEKKSIQHASCIACHRPPRDDHFPQNLDTEGAKRLFRQKVDKIRCTKYRDKLKK